MLIATGQKNSFYELDVGCWFGKREDSGRAKWKLYGNERKSTLIRLLAGSQLGGNSDYDH